MRQFATMEDSRVNNRVDMRSVGAGPRRGNKKACGSGVNNQVDMRAA